MTEPLRLSVIVPVYKGGSAFARCLEAVRSSEGLEPGSWELIVVQDGPDKESSETASRLADHNVRIDDGPSGPANARNRGAEVATGDVLVFVDADVVVHADALRRIRDLFAADATLIAAFGAYDDTPAQPDFLSQYRNLFHRYVHLLGAGEAETFWAGCGAVRTNDFRAVGGFDASVYPRPQIEDIELGYRLRARRGRIVLDPGIQGTHLKRWRLVDILRTDVMDRGIPWMRLMIRWSRTASRREGSLSVRRLEKVKTGLVGVALATLGLGVLLIRPMWIAVGCVTLAAVILLNWPTYAWFARLRGWGFAWRVVPMNLLYYVLSGWCVLVGWSVEMLQPRQLVHVDHDEKPTLGS